MIDMMNLIFYFEHFGQKQGNKEREWKLKCDKRYWHYLWGKKGVKIEMDDFFYFEEVVSKI